MAFHQPAMVQDRHHLCIQSGRLRTAMLSPIPTSANKVLVSYLIQFLAKLTIIAFILASFYILFIHEYSYLYVYIFAHPFFCVCRPSNVFSTTTHHQFSFTTLSSAFILNLLLNGYY